MSVKFVNGNDPKEKARIIDGCISELERHPEIGLSIIGTMTLDYIVEYLREYQNTLTAPISIGAFALHCLNDKEFGRGGIPSGEKVFLDALGMDYDTDENGVISGTSGDVARFYNALWILRDLSLKYPQGDNK